jgi:hypothetical protein
MVESLEDNDTVTFLAIQTVFEGHHVNTFDEIVKIQNQYNLKIQFGHDAGNDGNPRSSIMTDYRTGGTPWFIFIDQENNVVFSDFHLNVDAAINFLKKL